MQELEFHLSHITLRGLGFGDKSKPLILALHGWLDNAASFIPLSKYLDDYYVLAIDVTGHGLSDHRSVGAHYHLTDFVYDIHELVESQKWPPFILLGHSMGGIIASLYASCFGEQVSRFISIESFGPMTKEAESSPIQLKDSIKNRLQSQKSKARHPTSIDRTIDARAKAGDMKRDSASLLIERNIREENNQLFFNTDRRLRTFSSLRMTETQAKAFMQNILCPMLVVNGKDGFESMKNALKDRFAWVENLTQAECEGHHHLHMDNAKQVAEEIIKFLNA